MSYKDIKFSVFQSYANPTFVGYLCWLLRLIIFSFCEIEWLYYSAFLFYNTQVAQSCLYLVVTLLTAFPTPRKWKKGKGKEERKFTFMLCYSLNVHVQLHCTVCISWCLRCPIHISMYSHLLLGGWDCCCIEYLWIHHLEGIISFLLDDFYRWVI